MSKSGFVFPDTSQRVTIFGRTGSGKTQFAAWLLSEAPFHQQPYIVFDYKRDKLLGQIDFAKEIGIGEIPKHPGLYIVHPIIEITDNAVEAWLWRIWAKEQIGIYVDEGYSLPNKGAAFKAILTQGRSKNIPAIVLSQRPRDISRFIFTEADFYGAFHLNDRNDMKRCAEFMPPEINWRERQPKYNCRWYDVGQDRVFNMLPAPDAETILDKFYDRLKPVRKRV